MKVVLTDKVRALQKDIEGAKELRDFIASAKLNGKRSNNDALV
ncbi:hypothetical protein [Burkholderia gladioli]|nr:hypothetical protein [Burkholderia gladioli]MDA0576173.1 hypothetical protein [Burkholderia gladioli]MDA0604267.1 hypothetical protein [Burkholderia gladioli]